MRKEKHKLRSVPSPRKWKMPKEDKYKIIDASINRAREGLRVVEEIARFTSREKIYLRLRRIRHDITAITRRIYPKLVRARRSKLDPGFKLKEGARKNTKGLLIANFRRSGEAMRVLEEFSKLISPEAGK